LEVGKQGTGKAAGASVVGWLRVAAHAVEPAVTVSLDTRRTQQQHTQAHKGDVQTMHLGAGSLRFAVRLQARRKYQEVLAEKQQLQMDNEELQNKYNQKVM
jgi:hypothetical protein